jgi:L-lactate utilization protein LutC
MGDLYRLYLLLPIESVLPTFKILVLERSQTIKNAHKTVENAHETARNGQERSGTLNGQELWT